MCSHIFWINGFPDCFVFLLDWHHNIYKAFDLTTFRSSHLEVFYERAALKNSVKLLQIFFIFFFCWKYSNNSLMWPGDFLIFSALLLKLCKAFYRVICYCHELSKNRWSPVQTKRYVKSVVSYTIYYFFCEYFPIEKKNVM